MSEFTGQGLNHNAVRGNSVHWTCVQTVVNSVIDFWIRYDARFLSLLPNYDLYFLLFFFPVSENLRVRVLSLNVTNELLFILLC